MVLADLFDGTHPTAAGHAKIAKAVIAGINAWSRIDTTIATIPTKIISAFAAYLTADTATNATGDGTEYTVICDGKDFDVAGDFSGGAFTAPQDGPYHFDFRAMLGGNFSGGCTSIWAILKRSDGAIWQGQVLGPSARDSVHNLQSVMISENIYLIAGQTIVPQARAYGASSCMLGVSGNAGQKPTTFSGHRL
jgi:hypothetical protein